MGKRLGYLMLAWVGLSLVGFKGMKHEGQASLKEVAEVNLGLKEAPKQFRGSIVQAIHTEQYSYLELRSLEAADEETVWVATNRVTLKEGTRIGFLMSAPMVDFHSPTLKRTFPKIHFLSDFEVAAADLDSSKREVTQ